MDDATNPTTVPSARPRARCACGKPASYCTAETDWLDTCGDCLRALRRGETPPVAAPLPPPEAPMPVAAPLPPPGPAPAVKPTRRCYGIGCRRSSAAHGFCHNCLGRVRGRGLLDTAKVRRLTDEELGLLQIPADQARAKLQAATTPAPTVTAAPQTLDELLGPDVAGFVRSKMEQGAASEQLISCELTTLEECDLAIVAIQQRRGQIEQVIELRARAVALIAEAERIEAGFGR